MSCVTLVTGGTRGLGPAIANALKAAGHIVGANYAGNHEARINSSSETGIAVRGQSSSIIEADHVDPGQSCPVDFREPSPGAR